MTEDPHPDNVHEEVPDCLWVLLEDLVSCGLSDATADGTSRLSGEGHVFLQSLCLLMGGGRGRDPCECPQVYCVLDRLVDQFAGGRGTLSFTFMITTVPLELEDVYWDCL